MFGRDGVCVCTRCTVHESLFMHELVHFCLYLGVRACLCACVLFLYVCLVQAMVSTDYTVMLGLSGSLQAAWF